MPSVNDPRHFGLIKRTDECFVGEGFCVSEQTYHSGHMDPNAAGRLSITFSPTALHIRANADRIAAHPLDGMAFYYEAKAGTGKDICIEALPLADHMGHARRGVLCLYCCLDRRGVDRGFWAHAVPPLRTLFIPSQRTAELLNWYEDILPPLFPGVDVVSGFGGTRGSGDPFIAIDESVVAGLPSWRDLFLHEHTKWTHNGNSAWEHTADEWDEVFA